jgi:hypothetical protein
MAAPGTVSRVLTMASDTHVSERGDFAMLKANVGLSRKISRDYNSTGYSVNLDGEIPVSVDEPQAVIQKVRELFSLAQEALAQEIDRDQGEDSIGRRDEEHPTPRPEANGNGNGHTDRPSPGSAPRSTPTNGSGVKNGQNGQNGQNGNEESATNKQVQFLLTMGKRFKLSTPQLEGKVAEIIGRRCGVYDLTKREAGLVLDHFTKAANANGRQGK